MRQCRLLLLRLRLPAAAPAAHAPAGRIAVAATALPGLRLRLVAGGEHGPSPCGHVPPPWLERRLARAPGAQLLIIAQQLYLSEHSASMISSAPCTCCSHSALTATGYVGHHVIMHMPVFQQLHATRNGRAQTASRRRQKLR